MHLSSREEAYRVGSVRGPSVPCNSCRPFFLPGGQIRYQIFAGVEILWLLSAPTCIRTELAAASLTEANTGSMLGLFHVLTIIRNLSGRLQLQAKAKLWMRYGLEMMLATKKE